MTEDQPVGWAPKPQIRAKARRTEQTRGEPPAVFRCGHPGNSDYAIPSGKGYRCKCTISGWILPRIAHPSPPWPTVERTKEWR